MILRPTIHQSQLKTGERVAFKQFQNRRDFEQERNALLYFDGIGCAKLLDIDAAQQTLYIEWIEGRRLTEFFPAQDTQAVSYICEVLKKLHQSKQGAVFKGPYLRDWCQTLFKDHPLDSLLLNQARSIAKELLATSGQEIVLHGDLHHENIIVSERGPIAIDPKGVWGDPLFDTACSIYNPITLLAKTPNLAGLLQARITLFARNLAVEPCKIAHWAFVGVMLAICWCIEDGWGYQNLLSSAQVLSNLIL